VSEKEGFMTLKAGIEAARGPARKSSIERTNPGAGGSGVSLIKHLFVATDEKTCGLCCKQGLGKITSLLSVNFRPIFIAINQKNSGNSFVTLYIKRDLN
jgi:hypothetical protein